MWLRLGLFAALAAFVVLDARGQVSTTPGQCPTTSTDNLVGITCQIGGLVYSFSPVPILPFGLLNPPLFTPDSSGSGFTLSQLPAVNTQGGQANYDIQFSVSTADGAATITGMQVALNGASASGNGNVDGGFSAYTLSTFAFCVLPTSAVNNCAPFLFTSPISQITPASFNCSSCAVSAYFSLLGPASVDSIDYRFLQDCQVNRSDVRPYAGGPFSLDENLVSMNATFTPTDANGLPIGLAAAAAACGFTGFDWVQFIDHLPGPSMFFASSNPTVPIIIPPQSPIKDPPLGGYTYQSSDPPFFDANPFYYNAANIFTSCAEADLAGACILSIVSNSGDTLNFFDEPADPCLPGGLPGGSPSDRRQLRTLCKGDSSGPPFISFRTQLVGICNSTPSALCSEAGKPSVPLFQWSWKDNFNGEVGEPSTGTGGVFFAQTASFFPVNPSSGTGGVTITSVNGAPQTPPSTVCNATLQRREDKPALITVTGTVTPGTSPIPSGSTIYSVTKGKKQIQSGSFVVNAGGGYSFQFSPSKSGDDGEEWKIIVAAADGIGNVGSCSTTVQVPDE
jgi:hypothetical protein